MGRVQIRKERDEIVFIINAFWFNDLDEIFWFRSVYEMLTDNPCLGKQVYFEYNKYRILIF